MAEQHQFHVPQQQTTPAFDPSKIEPMQVPTTEAGNLGAASFNLGGAGEFIPKGKMVATKEQFPDLGDMDDQGPKKKKGGKGKKKKAVSQPTAAEEEDVDNSVAWKGKKSEFFIMKPFAEPQNDPSNPNNMDMNQDQWNFIFKHFPEYGGGPYDMMVWLYGQAKAHEDMYLKPTQGGTQVEGEEDDDLDDSKYDQGFGKSQQ
jgi:hypothetical protein